MKRFDHLHKQYRAEKMKEYSNKALRNSRKAVIVNANGTSGYTVKEGKNKGKILGHISQKHSNNW